MLLAIVMMGCIKSLEKEGVYSETEYKGRIVTTERDPVAGVSVFLRDASGDKKEMQITGDDGCFCFSTELKDLVGDTFYFDGGGSRILEKPIKGIGREVYDYGDIVLYNSKIEELPKMPYMGKTYYIYPKFNYPVKRTEAYELRNNVNENLDDNYDCQDWFLPNERELKAMFDYYKDSIGSFFDGGYWCSDYHDGFPLYVDFPTGVVKQAELDDYYYVRLVRTNSGANLDDPVVETGEIVDIAQRSAKYDGKILSDGGSSIIVKGVCWSTSPNPSFEESAHSVSETMDIGSYSIVLTGLQPSTKYYVRGYAKNAKGGERYGTELEFTTKKESEITVSISNATDVTSTKIKCTIDLELVSGTFSGILGACWNTSPNPSIETNHVVGGNVYGSGSKEVTLTGLQPETKYYIRGYAQNEITQEITYSLDEKVVTTKNPVRTIEVNEVTTNTAKGVGELEAWCEGTFSFGFCWSIFPEPTVEDHHTITTIIHHGTPSIKPINVNMPDLISGMNYYARAYAKRDDQDVIYYGEEIMFTTR